MKTIFTAFLAVLLLLPVPAVGEIQTVTHTVKQSFGGSQSPDDARISAVAKAKREALELAGTYIESLTVVKNYQVDKDEILALSAGVLKAEVVSQENFHTKDAFGIDVVVNVVVDTSVLEERVKKLLQDRTHLEQLNQARLREKELLKKIAALEGENRKIGKSGKKAINLKKEFQAASQGLTAVDWLNKALALWQNGKNTDPQKAVEYLNESIRLKPDNARAFVQRGAVYDMLGQHKRAIEDYNQAIRLKPDFDVAYANRGVTYNGFGQNQKAIEDLTKAISLNPSDATSYNNRGFIYDDLEKYSLAIEDFSQAIRINPSRSSFYQARASAYASSHNNTAACSDYEKACELGDCGGYDVFKDLLFCKSDSMESARAKVPKPVIDLFADIGNIAAYDKAIRLNPKDEHGPK
ncbi:MAG: tetratricopeptide repeat protein [Syntrophales bacterium]